MSSGPQRVSLTLPVDKIFNTVSPAKRKWDWEHCCISDHKAARTRTNVHAPWEHCVCGCFAAEPSAITNCHMLSCSFTHTQKMGVINVCVLHWIHIWVCVWVVFLCDRLPVSFCIKKVMCVLHVCVCVNMHQHPFLSWGYSSCKNTAMSDRNLIFCPICVKSSHMQRQISDHTDNSASQNFSVCVLSVHLPGHFCVPEYMFHFPWGGTVVLNCVTRWVTHTHTLTQGGQAAEKDCPRVTSSRSLCGVTIVQHFHSSTQLREQPWIDYHEVKDFNSI